MTTPQDPVDADAGARRSSRDLATAVSDAMVRLANCLSRAIRCGTAIPPRPIEDYRDVAVLALERLRVALSKPAQDSVDQDNVRRLHDRARDQTGAVRQAQLSYERDVETLRWWASEWRHYAATNRAAEREGQHAR